MALGGVPVEYLSTRPLIAHPNVVNGIRRRAALSCVPERQPDDAVPIRDTDYTAGYRAVKAVQCSSACPSDDGNDPICRRPDRRGIVSHGCCTAACDDDDALEHILHRSMNEAQTFILEQIGCNAG
jgi:hypothetical protein